MPFIKEGINKLLVLIQSWNKNKWTSDELFRILLISIIGFFILLALVFLVNGSTNLNQPMDFIGAVGTLILAAIALYTIGETEKSSKEYTDKIDKLVVELGRDRYIEHIRLQIDELYMPIICYGRQKEAYFEPDGVLFERIKRKKYLGEPKFRELIDEYILSRDEYEQYSSVVSRQAMFRNGDRSWSTDGEGKDRAISAEIQKQRDMEDKAVKLRGEAERDVVLLQDRMSLILKEGIEVKDSRALDKV